MIVSLRFDESFAVLVPEEQNSAFGFYEGALRKGSPQCVDSRLFSGSESSFGKFAMRAAYRGVVIIIISKDGYDGFGDLGQVI